MYMCVRMYVLISERYFGCKRFAVFSFPIYASSLGLVLSQGLVGLLHVKAAEDGRVDLGLKHFLGHALQLEIISYFL